MLTQKSAPKTRTNSAPPRAITFLASCVLGLALLCGQGGLRDAWGQTTTTPAPLPAATPSNQQGQPTASALGNLQAPVPPTTTNPTYNLNTPQVAPAAAPPPATIIDTCGPDGRVSQVIHNNALAMQQLRQQNAAAVFGNGPMYDNTQCLMTIVDVMNMLNDLPTGSSFDALLQTMFKAFVAKIVNTLWQALVNSVCSIVTQVTSSLKSITNLACIPGMPGMPGFGFNLGLPQFTCSGTNVVNYARSMQSMQQPPSLAQMGGAMYMQGVQAQATLSHVNYLWGNFWGKMTQ